MKRTVLIFIVAICCMAGSLALAEDDPQITFSTQLSSSYIHPYSGYKSAKDPGLVSEITIEPKFAKGAYLYLYNFSSLHNPGHDELDYMLGWAGKVGPVEVDAGFVYYDTRKYFDPQWDFYGIFLEVSKPFKINKRHELKPFVRAEADFPVMVNSRVGSGYYFTVGLKHTWKITEKWNCEHSLSGNYDSGNFGLNQASFGGYDGKLAYKVNKHLDLNPILITARTPLNNTGDGRETVVSVAAGITIKF